MKALHLKLAALSIINFLFCGSLDLLDTPSSKKAITAWKIIILDNFLIIKHVCSSLQLYIGKVALSWVDCEL